MRQGEPWHIQYKDHEKENMTKHEETLARIHRLEHDLNMNPEYSSQCSTCNYLFNRHQYWQGESMYDPDIEGVIRR